MSDTLSGMATGETVARDAHALSIIIPAKDEEELLPLVVARIIAACRAGGHTLRDIVLVDDGSSDNTWEVMSKLAGDSEVIEAIRLRRNFGKATALMVGIGACRGDVIITMDADLQDDPDEISRFVETLDRRLRPRVGLEAGTARSAQQDRALAPLQQSDGDASAG